MKIAIIGLGSVGSAVATAVHNTGLVHEMVLFDRDMARARAAAEDLGHASSFSFDIKITPASNYRGIKGSDIVIIAAGANQKPGQTRMDLLQSNAGVIRDIIPNLMPNIDTKRAKIIVVTNPLDVMVMLAQKLSKLPASRVVGTGTMLDSGRLKIILSRHLGVSHQSVNAYVLGEHGDSSVINWTGVSVGNIGLGDFCKQAKIPMSSALRQKIEDDVHYAAYEIIKGRGATWDGIGAAVSDLLRCMINDEKRILTVSHVDGAGAKALAMSLPRVVGSTGVQLSLRPNMNKEEAANLRKSAAVIHKNFNQLKS